jgi:hypothetical protein
MSRKMSISQDVEVISREIDRVAIKVGRALAKSYAANFCDQFEVITPEQKRVADFIFLHAAADVLDTFPALNVLERLKLRNRAIDTIKAAFETRLAELCSG